MSQPATTQVPALLTVPEAASILGIGRTLAYRLIREGSWPRPIIRAGKLIKIPSAPLVDFVDSGTLHHG